VPQFNFCPYLRQILTDFENSFNGTLCRQFEIKHLTLNASLHYRVKYEFSKIAPTEAQQRQISEHEVKKM